MDIGGAESHIYSLCLGYKKAGHRVCVISAGGVYADMLKKAGISHITLPLDKKSPDAMHLCKETLARLIKTHRPDIVHSHSRIPSFICGRLKKVCKEAGTCFVTTAHMPYTATPMLRAASEWGEHCICVSEDIKSYQTEVWGIDEHDITVIRNGIDTEHFSPDAKLGKKTREALGIPEDAFVISTASRSSESRGKAALFLAERASSFLSEGEHIIICLSGPVGSEADLTELIAQQAVFTNERSGSNTVHLIIGECDIRPYLCASDVFVGVSRAAMEAMSCALPVIIAGNEGVGSVFTQENEELLLASNLTARGCDKSFDSIPLSIEALRTKEERARIGRYSREYAKAHFSSEYAAKKTLEVYKKTAEDKKDKPTLFFIGHYGSGNCGDDASLSVIRRELSDKYNIKYLCKYKKYAGDGAVLRSDIAEIVNTARQSRAVILGTGNLLQDMTSTRSLSYYCALFTLCRRLCKNNAVFGGGIGPLSGKRSKELAGHILSGAGYISVRERLSERLAEELCKGKKIYLGADTVLLTKAVPTPLSDDISGEYCLIFPRAGADTGTEALAELILKTKEEGITPILVPMDTELDTEVCNTLCEGGAEVLYDLGAGEILTLIRGAAFTVCGRLHAAVLSLCAGTPYVSIDYDGRAGAFCAVSGCGITLAGDELEGRELVLAFRAAREYYDASQYKEAADRLAREAKKDIQRLSKWAAVL